MRVIPAPLVGWRYLRVPETQTLRTLFSPTTHWQSRLESAAWHPRGVMRAECMYHDHAAPDPECNCGFYALENVYTLLERPVHFLPQWRLVVVRTESWGRARIAQDGWRTELTRVTGVRDQTDSSSRRREVAELFEVPLLAAPPEPILVRLFSRHATRFPPPPSHIHRSFDPWRGGAW